MLNISWDTSNGKKFPIADGKKSHICKWHFLPFSSFTITEKNTSELTESPRKWKTLFGVSCERKNKPINIKLDKYLGGGNYNSKFISSDFLFSPSNIVKNVLK